MKSSVKYSKTGRNSQTPEDLFSDTPQGIKNSTLGSLKSPFYLTGDFTVADLKTDSGSFLKRNETETTIDLPTKEDNPNYFSVDEPRSFSEAVFSDNYIKYRTSKLILEIIPNFTKWSEVGFNDGLVYISEIKHLLESYAKILDFRDENRLLVGTLQLLISGKDLETYTSSQLKSISRELERFREGEVSSEQLGNFTRQLYRFGISLL